MIKRIFLTLLVSILFSAVTFADEQHDVVLDNGEHNQSIIELHYCNIKTTLVEVDSKDNATINVEIENKHDSKVLLLFNQPYNEKELKKQSPSIRFDKYFPGNKGQRIIESISNLAAPCKLMPNMKVSFNVVCNYGESAIVRLPIYMAEISPKDLLELRFSKRIKLMGLDRQELTVRVNLKPDEDYVRLDNAASELISEIQKETFCTNKRHRGTSYAQLVKKYSEQREEIKIEINSIINTRRYLSSDRKYKMYHSIIQKLDAIKFEEIAVNSCGNDRKRVVRDRHSCEYCSLDYQEIYERIQNIYISLHNGKASKPGVMHEVEALHNCVVNNAKRKGGGSVKASIKKFYNRIKSL